MSISALFILDNISGSTLIFRDYKGNTSQNVTEQFPILVSKNEEEGSSNPVIHSNNTSFAYIPINDLYLVSVMKGNANITLVFSFMHSFVKILENYLNKVEAESIKDNFVIIHELLDEVIDFGYPQITNPNILQTYILQNSFQLNKAAILPAVLTNVVSWRPEGLKYRKNEVFIDVVESVNLTISSNKNVLSHEVNGCLKMKAHLSGMPQLRLGLSDKMLLEVGTLNRRDSSFEGIKFHQCVQLSRLCEKNLYFIPPDGEFDLMSYRVNADHVKPLIKVEATETKFSFSRVEYSLKAVSQFKASSTANNVEILLPVEEFADSPSVRTSAGRAIYEPERNSILWKIKFLPGGMEHFLKAQFKLSSFESQEKLAKRPIEVKFTIPYFTVSGLQVRFIKVIEKSDYKAFTWVRYTTQNGQFVVNFK